MRCVWGGRGWGANPCPPDNPCLIFDSHQNLSCPSVSVGELVPGPPPMETKSTDGSSPWYKMAQSNAFSWLFASVGSQTRIKNSAGIYWKISPPISGPTHFKLVWFKGHMYFNLEVYKVILIYDNRVFPLWKRFFLLKMRLYCAIHWRRWSE